MPAAYDTDAWWTLYSGQTAALNAKSRRIAAAVAIRDAAPAGARLDAWDAYRAEVRAAEEACDAEFRRLGNEYNATFRA